MPTFLFSKAVPSSHQPRRRSKGITAGDSSASAPQDVHRRRAKWYLEEHARLLSAGPLPPFDDCLPVRYTLADARDQIATSADIKNKRAVWHPFFDPPSSPSPDIPEPPLDSLGLAAAGEWLVRGTAVCMERVSRCVAHTPPPLARRQARGALADLASLPTCSDNKKVGVNFHAVTVMRAKGSVGLGDLLVEVTASAHALCGRTFREGHFPNLGDFDRLGLAQITPATKEGCIYYDGVWDAASGAGIAGYVGIARQTGRPASFHANEKLWRMKVPRVRAPSCPSCARPKADSSPPSSFFRSLVGRAFFHRRRQAVLGRRECRVARRRGPTLLRVRAAPGASSSRALAAPRDDVLTTVLSARRRTPTGQAARRPTTPTAWPARSAAPTRRTASSCSSRSRRPPRRAAGVDL